jgi:hypothetical protein
MTEPLSGDDGDDEEPGSGRSRANVAALIAIVVLAALGYWAFNAIDHARQLQKCLDEGRRNCMDLVSPEK